jgi:hypothetical protein
LLGEWQPPHRSSMIGSTSFEKVGATLGHASIVFPKMHCELPPSAFSVYAGPFAVAQAPSNDNGDNTERANNLDFAVIS